MANIVLKQWLRPSLWKVCLIFYLSCFATSIDAVCNVCQENEAACINSTSFYLCFGDNQPNTDVLYHCKDGFECTNLNAICVQASNDRHPSCGDTSQCGLCSAHRNYVFSCQSRTTFQMCYGAARPSGRIGYCPQGYVCDANSDAICVNAATVNTVTCDILPDESTTPSYTTTTTTTELSTEATTSTARPLMPHEVCAQQRQVGLFPTTPNDPFCKRYIYCYYNNGIIKGIEYTCSTGTYYDTDRELCSYHKPAHCI